MKKSKFEVGVEIPKSMQEALLGGQGSEGLSLTISLGLSANLSSSKDRDSDGDESEEPDKSRKEIDKIKP